MTPSVEVEVQLSQQTAPWMLDNRDLIAGRLAQVRIHQPTFEHMADAVASDVRDPWHFFMGLGLRVRTSGLPACVTPGCELVEPIQRISPVLFDPETGRIDIRALSHRHIQRGYDARSERCPP